jgi:deoxycytidylate deaminase
MIDYTCNVRDERFANFALIEANKSTMVHNHGCVAVMGGRLIAKGFNSDRCYSSDGFLTNSCSCHAEIDVLRQLDKKLKKKRIINKKNRNLFYEKISLYVVRKKKGYDINNDNIINIDIYKDSAPCVKCSEIMKKLGVKYIIYSNINGTLTKCRVRDYITTHISHGTRVINNRMSRDFPHKKKS